MVSASVKSVRGLAAKVGGLHSVEPRLSPWARSRGFLALPPPDPLGIRRRRDLRKSLSSSSEICSIILCHILGESSVSVYSHFDLYFIIL